MKSIRSIAMIILCIQPAFGSATNFNDLLKCNLAQRNIAAECDVQREMMLYQNALAIEENYPGSRILDEWVNGVYVYPHVHPTHQSLLDIVKSLPDIKTVCDIGAGCGEVSKYIFAQNPWLDLTCVEYNSRHFAQIEENFEKRTGVIKPNIPVRAKRVRDSFPNLAHLESNEYDLVFTCAVMMHIPFIPAVKSAMEIYRISKKYILHVENKNDGQAWYNMTVVKPKEMSSVNCTGIDYVKLYESLGVKTLVYEEYKHPDCPGTYVVYLGQKTDNLE